MWKTSLLALMMAATIFVATPTRAETPETDFTGHYELANDNGGRVFTLEVKQHRERADVSFSAAMTDGSGSAPDGSGPGRIEDGVLSFKFKDSFNNEGTCKLFSGKGGYHLSMTVVKAVDPGPFHFYGNVLLKKTSSHPK